MKRIIAICGVACHQCPTFLATQSNDYAKRVEVAKLWSKHFNTDFKPEDMNCDGCQSQNGRLFGYCQTCDIRKCGIEKKIENCAHCSDYSCEKLNNLFKILPDAKKHLEQIRATI